MTIRPWTKVGELTPVTEDFYGKRIVLQVLCDPEGGRHAFYFYSLKDSVVVLAITRRGQRVLLTREYKQGCGQVLETPVGGYCDPGETPEVAARRELKEETGFIAGRLISLGHIWLIPRHSNAKVALFLALDCRESGEGQQLNLIEEIKEEIEVVQVPLRKWLRRTERDSSGDPLSAVLALRALRYLNRKIIATR